MKIGYARVSTKDQSLPRQVEKLEEEGCEKVFTAKISGGAQQRPTMDKVFEHLREGDMLVVHRLDRLGRDMRGLVEWINDLHEMGVEFKSLKEGIDTSTEVGEFFFYILAAFAEFDRRRKRERTKEGLEQARREGRTGGRPYKVAKEDLPMLSRLMKDPDVSVAQILDRFEISRACLYSHVGPNGELRSNMVEADTVEELRESKGTS